MLFTVGDYSLFTKFSNQKLRFFWCVKNIIEKNLTKASVLNCLTQVFEYLCCISKVCAGFTELLKWNMPWDVHDKIIAEFLPYFHKEAYEHLTFAFGLCWIIFSAMLSLKKVTNKIYKSSCFRNIIFPQLHLDLWLIKFRKILTTKPSSSL